MGEHIFFEEELFMTKGKKFFLGMAVLLMSASLFFLGCSTGEDTTVEVKSGSVYGNLGSSDLQAEIDDAVENGRSLTLRNVRVSDTGAVNLKNANVTIVGDLALQNTGVLAAAEATVKFASGAKITGNSLVIIGSEDDFGDYVPGSSPEFVPTVEETEIAGTTGPAKIAIGNYTLGAAGVVPANVTLYVYGKLAVGTGSAAPTNSSAKVMAVGTVDVTVNSNALVSVTAVDYSNAVITSSATGGVTLTLASTVVKAAFDIEEGKDITLHTDTAIISSAKITGKGTLKVPGTVTAVTTTGTGNIEFPNATGAITALSLGNTGTIKFGHTGAALTIGNATSAVFGGDVTLAGGIATAGSSDTSTIVFHKNVTLATTMKITFGATTSDAVTLKQGAAIKVGNDTLVAATFEDVSFTAAVANAALTATTVASPGLSKLAVSAQDIGVDGTLVVLGELDTGSQDVAADALAVVSGAKITTGSGKGIDLGGTNGVTLKGAGSWTAGGASTTAIFLAGATDASSISCLTQTGTPAIGTFTASGTTVLAVSAGDSGPNMLTVAAGTTLSVGSGCSISLTGDGSNPGTLVLASAAPATTAAAGGGGKLVLTGGGTDLGASGVIKPAGTLLEEKLIATGSSGVFVLPGAAATDYGSITSIEAATPASTGNTDDGTVTFNGGSSGTATLSSSSTLKSAS
jgi:hypothetical protein